MVRLDYKYRESTMEVLTFDAAPQICKCTVGCYFTPSYMLMLTLTIVGMTNLTDVGYY